MLQLVDEAYCISHYFFWSSVWPPQFVTWSAPSSLSVSVGGGGGGEVKCRKSLAHTASFGLVCVDQTRCGQVHNATPRYPPGAHIINKWLDCHLHAWPWAPLSLNPHPVAHAVYYFVFSFFLSVHHLPCPTFFPVFCLYCVLFLLGCTRESTREV